MLKNIAFGGILAAVIIPVAAAAVLYVSYVFSWLWLWFIAEPFGIRELSLAHAYGIMLVVSLLFKWDIERYQTKKSDDSSILTTVTFLCVPLLSLGIGWFVHSFFM